ncbi:MAG: Flp pilus assembly protein CpaB, partial [Caldilineaceae bacterium]|nr:Flp pilus assembly protein CpaB [Caldilineaceae bacterium]
MNRSPILPIVLALATFALLALALWPQEEPTNTIVVAGRDLGAGTILAPSDLKTVTLPADQAPADAVGDVALLVGESLSVVRYSGEPVTPRHLGPAVILAPDERGIAVRVQADTGLAGLLRPGMTVGVVATLRDDMTNKVYAKSTLENLRVLYVPPSFQARSPQTVVYASGGDGTYAPPPPVQEPVREGVVVLAAGTLPEPVVYEEAETILLRALAEEQSEAEGEPPDVMWAVPVELLAALNAADASFT